MKARPLPAMRLLGGRGASAEPARRQVQGRRRADRPSQAGHQGLHNWPTIPQLYVKGEFVGGCDIVREMYSSRRAGGPAEGEGRAGPRLRPCRVSPDPPADHSYPFAKKPGRPDRPSMRVKPAHRMEARTPEEASCAGFAALSLTLVVPAAGAEDADKPSALNSTASRRPSTPARAARSALSIPRRHRLPARHPRVEGREAIGKLWQSVIQYRREGPCAGGGRLRRGADKMAYEVGRVTLSTPRRPGRRKYIVLWEAGR